MIKHINIDKLTDLELSQLSQRNTKKLKLSRIDKSSLLSEDRKRKLRRRIHCFNLDNLDKFINVLERTNNPMR